MTNPAPQTTQLTNNVKVETTAKCDSSKTVEMVFLNGGQHLYTTSFTRASPQAGPLNQDVTVGNITLKEGLTISGYYTNNDKTVDVTLNGTIADGMDTKNINGQSLGQFDCP